MSICNVTTVDCDHYTISKSDICHKHHFLKKIIYKIIGVIRDTLYGFFLMYLRVRTLFYRPKEYINPAKSIEWSPENKGLFVFIHGLYGHPSEWDRHIKNLKKRKLKIEIVVPYIPKSGGCSLQQAALPVLNLIKDYAKKNQGKPICLVAISNGARVANYVDKHLRNDPVALKVSTISGAHYGSFLMSLLNKVPLLRCTTKKCLRTELSYKSHYAKSLLDDLKKEVTIGKRSYDFYASTADSMVFPYTSALPILNQQENHFVVHTDGHISIVNTVRNHQINRCVNWIQTNQTD